MDTALLPGTPREEAIPWLMEEYGNAILRMCFLYLGNRSLAEDAVQETFIKAYRKFHTFRGESGAKTRLMRIAINICKDSKK